MNVREQEQAEEQAAFEQAFASVSGIPASPTVASNDAAAGDAGGTGTAPEGNGETPANAPETSGAAPGATEASGEQAGEKPADSPAAEEDPVLLDGLKRSELRRLLSNAADVDSLRKQLDKAHGSIGDLNRRLQQAVPVATPAPQQVRQLPPELQQFEQDYPEFAAYVKALGITPQSTQEAAPPAEQAHTEATGAQVPVQAGQDAWAVELAVMDRVHKGWREKVVTPDFKLWLARQPDDVRDTYENTMSADELGGIVSKYDTESAARETRQTQGRNRLERALTPSGNAPRPQAAPTEDEAMRAAFAATMGRR
jgi:hypothetical protein